MNQKRIINNFVWRLMERIGAQGIAFIISIVLARILDPDVYGTVALVTAIITVLNVLVDSGLGTALIQKKDADQLDFSTVFWFNLITCSLLYVALFLFAKSIANYYEILELKDIIRVLGIGIIISGIKNVQQAYVSRNMIFKKFFYSTLGGTIISGVIGIVVAIKGGGVWALVIQNISNQFFDTVILWITVRWRPSLEFSILRFKSLFSFGWKLLATSLISTIYDQIRQFIIGKKYNSESLAYYNQGNKLPALIVNNINTSIDSVLLPVFSQEQNNPSHIKEMMRKTIKVSTYILLPIMGGLAACATSFVKIVLTDKWLPCVPYIRIFCICYAFYPINTANLNAIKAMGRSDLNLKLEIIKKSIGIIAIIVTMNINTIALAYSFMFSIFFAQIVNAIPNKRLLNYSYLSQLKDIFPQTLLTGIMIGVLLIIEKIIKNSILLFISQIIVGLAVYLFGSLVLRIDAYYSIINITKSYLNRKQ